MGERSDEQLMLEYQQGSEEAFTVLYQRYRGRVFGFLRKRIENSEAQEEIFQLTFQKLHKYRHRYKASLPFQPWIFTILRNCMNDSLRKHRTTSKTLETFSQQPVLEKEETERAQLSLENLNERQRETVKMRYFEELPFEEIAQRLQTSPANVRQILSRALKALRKRPK